MTYRADRIGLGAAALAGAMVALGSLATGSALAGTSSALLSSAAGSVDTIIFRDGRKVEGKIIEENETTVKINVMVAGLSAETSYDKANILLIEYGDDDDEVVEEVKPGAKAAAAPKRNADVPREGAKSVYVLNLTGEFGRDISQTPIRDAMEDAKSKEADYVICVLDNDWSFALVGGMAEEDLPDDANAFDQLWRAEDMDPIFTDEIEREWEKKPTVVFWIKQAMGGAAFLPFNCPNIYFASDARMGGIGNLTYMFGSTGDEVVRQKQYSLRLGHAKGMANRGGYDTKIVEAMTIFEKAYCYKMDRGKAIIYDRMPESADEHLLAEDGTDERYRDTIQELARGQGNDTLTLNAKVARDLGLSKGTVDTLDDLLFELGIERNSVIISKADATDDEPTSASDRIMSKWSDACDNAERDMRRLWREYGQIQVAGDYRERQAARGRQIRTLENIIRLIKRYGEAVFPQGVGVPPQSILETIIEQIRLEMLRDSK